MGGLFFLAVIACFHLSSFGSNFQTYTSPKLTITTYQVKQQNYTKMLLIKAACKPLRLSLNKCFKTNCLIFLLFLINV